MPEISSCLFQATAIVSNRIKNIQSQGDYGEYNTIQIHKCVIFHINAKDIEKPSH